MSSCHLLLDHVQFALIHGPNIPGSYAVLFFIALDFTFNHQTCLHLRVFLLWPSNLILSGTISNCPLLFPRGIHLQAWGAHLLVSYLSAFSYFSWGSPGKKTGEGCHFLLQWAMFVSTMTCLSWVALHSPAQSFIELWKPLCHDKAVITFAKLSPPLCG